MFSRKKSLHLILYSSDLDSDTVHRLSKSWKSSGRMKWPWLPITAVLNSAKQKAAGFRWPMGEQFMSSTTPLPPAVDGSSLSTPTDMEAEELPLSSSLTNVDNDLATAVDEDLKRS